MNRYSLIGLVLFGILFLFYLVYVQIQMAPFLTSGMLVLTIVTLAYIASEQLITHAAAEFENRFWSLMVFLFLVLLAFSPDSPVTLGMDDLVSVFFSWFVILAITFCAHNYDRHLVRLKLKKLPKINQMKRSLSTEFGHETKLATKEKLKKLHELSNFIDQQWFASTFVNLFWLGNVLLIERQIIDIFKDADAKQLNYILSDFPIAHLFYKVKDHWMVRDYHRTQLLELLTVERLGVLTVKSRVMLIHGLQLKKLSANARSENYCKNILLKTTGDQLSELKCLTDSKGDYHNMHKLIYKDIRSPDIRNELLAHFAKQAQVQRAHSLLGSRAGKKRSLYAWRKIVCDVDDTLVCSGGSFPAGMDTSYPKKELYPGVLGFLRELDLGTTKSSPTTIAPAASAQVSYYKHNKLADLTNKVNYVWEENRLSNLVFLSARPHVYSDISEQMTYGKFENLRKNRGLHGNPTLLCGALDTGAKFIVKNDMEPLAVTKFANYSEYSAIYPEFKVVFIGDNGQGDVRVSEMIMDSGADAMQGSLERVYIHLVQPLHKTHVKSDGLLCGTQSKNVCYFNTYVDAAVDALKHGLIQITGLRNVIEEAKFDVELITPEGWSSAAKSSGGGGGGRLRDERVRELNQSIHLANKLLLANGLSCAVPILFKAKFGLGSAVRSSYGMGIVERFYPETGFYLVAVPLQVVRTKSGTTTVSWMRVSVEGLQLNSFKSVSMSNNRAGNALQSIVSAPYKDGTKSRSLLSIASTSSIVGYIVWTPYGVATAIAVRAKEAIVECRNNWGATCYLQFDKVVVIHPPLAPPPEPASPPGKFADPTSKSPERASSSATAALEAEKERGAGYFSIVKWLFSSSKASSAADALASADVTEFVTSREQRLEAGIISSCDQRAFTTGDYVMCAPFGACGIVSSRIDTPSSSAGSSTDTGGIVMYEMRLLRREVLLGDTRSRVGDDEVMDTSMRLFCPASAVTKFVCGELGQTLQTPYGPAVLLAVQPCGVHVVKSASIPCMVMYLHPKCVWC